MLPQKEAVVPEKTKSVWESFAEMMRKQRLTLAEQEERQRFQMWHHRGLLVELKYLPNNKTCCEFRGRSGGGIKTHGAACLKKNPPALLVPVLASMLND